MFNDDPFKVIKRADLPQELRGMSKWELANNYDILVEEEFNATTGIDTNWESLEYWESLE